MSAYNTTLEDKEGNEVYPKTLASNVYDGADRMDQKVSGIRTDLGSPSSASGITGSDAFTKINNVNTNLGSPSSAAAVTGADAFSKISKLNSDIAVWTDITNSCSWAVAAAFDSNYPKCVKVKPKAGLMYIKFVLAAGIVNGTTILTLPSGYSLDKQVFLRMKEDGYVKQIGVDTSDTRIIKLIRDANVATTDNTPITVTVPYYVS